MKYINQKNESLVWNLNPLLNNDNDPKIKSQRKLVEKANVDFVHKWQKRKDYLKDEKVLKTALDELEILNRYYGTSGSEGYYFLLRSEQEENNTDVKAKFNQVQEFEKKIENDLQFFTIRLSKISLKKQQEFINSPILAAYKHFLEHLFLESKYILSEPEEKILNLKSPTSYGNWVKMTSGFLSKETALVLSAKGKKEKRNFSEIMSLLDDKNKNVRDSAATAFNSILEKNIDVAVCEINSVLSDKKVNDQLRKTARPDEIRHISDDIRTDVVDSLIMSVSKRNDLSKRYYNLKARLLGVKKLAYHERNIEYGSIDKKYTYDDANRLVLKVFDKLDSKFAVILRDFIENGQIDVFPKKDKTSGAFCIHGLLTQPTFVLLNHTDKLNDVLTIAHEMGHAINNELSRLKQNSLNFGTPLSTAEAASTFMEDFVLQELLKESRGEIKLSLMMSKLNSDISTIFRQVACYRFEQELHAAFREKGYLSRNEMGILFHKHMEGYLGPAVELSKGSENWWVYWSHIRNFFYVYSYASGLLISKFMQSEVKKDPKFIEKVKEFLSAGLSASPEDIFKQMGIDIADRDFWNKGLVEIETLLTETEELAKRLGKI